MFYKASLKQIREEWLIDHCIEQDCVIAKETNSILVIVTWCLPATIDVKYVVASFQFTPTKKILTNLFFKLKSCHSVLSIGSINDYLKLINFYFFFICFLFLSLNQPSFLKKHSLVVIDNLKHCNHEWLKFSPPFKKTVPNSHR